VHELWLDDITRALADAACEWHLRSGIDRGDKLRNAAKAVYESRQR
jgi:hypothetical protein